MLTLLVCLSLCVYSQGSPLGCRWLDDKFRLYSQNSLELLDTMVNNSTNSSVEPEEMVIFPQELYRQTFNASAEDKLALAAQIMNETVALLMEDHSGASWDEKQVENVINVLTQQADNLQACMVSPGHKRSEEVERYFNRLSNHILKKMDYSAAAWELIREEIETLLMQTHLLVSTLLSTP
ncbi:interferon a3-like [Takifugu flavidus]|uniref:Interferon a3 n=1 Tax=Takifugu flavidus TaxID=433684 RepID=A0A5C6PT57_9TELE|nr:interferon a3-like [Takifugu flavidus]TWW82186.1 Interferon a3 [Takifugu flavidus]